MNLWEDFPDVRPLTFHPRLGQAAAELLGVDSVRLWHDQALYKQAGGRATDPHQDQPYWPVKETASVTAWIPFDGSTLDVRRDGVPAGIAHGRPAQVRQHLLRRAARHPRRPRGRGHRAGVRRGAEGLGRVPSRVDRAPRRAERDRPRPRRAHDHLLAVDGSTRGYPFPHFAVDRCDIEVGQVIDGDVTPIVWPRPDGDLPDRPAVSFDLPAGIANTGALPNG